MNELEGETFIRIVESLTIFKLELHLSQNSRRNNSRNPTYDQTLPRPLF